MSSSPIPNQQTTPSVAVFQPHVIFGQYPGRQGPPPMFHMPPPSMAGAPTSNPFNVPPPQSMLRQPVPYGAAPLFYSSASYRMPRNTMNGQNRLIEHNMQDTEDKTYI